VGETSWRPSHKCSNRSLRRHLNTCGAQDFITSTRSHEKSCVPASPGWESVKLNADLPLGLVPRASLIHCTSTVPVFALGVELSHSASNSLARTGESHRCRMPRLHALCQVLSHPCSVEATGKAALLLSNSFLQTMLSSSIRNKPPPPNMPYVTRSDGERILLRDNSRCTIFISIGNIISSRSFLARPLPLACQTEVSPFQLL
jgi:hypothetical protein